MESDHSLGGRQDDQGKRQDEQGLRQEESEARQTAAETRLDKSDAKEEFIERRHDESMKYRQQESFKARWFRRGLVVWIILFTIATGWSVRKSEEVASQNRKNIISLDENKASNADLRAQVNRLGKKGCFGGRINVEKYNDLVQSIIEGRIDQKKAALANGDFKAAALHQKAINRYRQDFLPVTTVRTCNKPIIKPQTFNRPG